MSGAIRLPSEIEKLFSYSDEDGLLDPEDLKEAGFEYLRESGETETWEKNDTIVKYSPEKRSLEDYTCLR